MDYVLNKVHRERSAVAEGDHFSSPQAITSDFRRSIRACSQFGVD